MNILPFERQVAGIAALIEGCSIRATERLTDVHRDPIMRLGVRAGDGRARRKLDQRQVVAPAVALAAGAGGEPHARNGGHVGKRGWGKGRDGRHR